MKTNIIYTNNILTVYFSGGIRKRSLNSFKKKLFNIVDEYQIDNIVFDLSNSAISDDLNFLIEDYSKRYNNEIRIIQ